MVITTKAGYRMWDGPYGDGGSRKYLLNSLDQSLTRLGLDHVDIFYHHREDPQTPLEETMGRSEERRVGKECRSRWWPDREKKKARKRPLERDRARTTTTDKCARAS